MEQKSKTPMIVGIGAVLVVLIALITWQSSGSESDEKNAPPKQDQATEESGLDSGENSPTMTPTTPTDAAFADGTYSANGTYRAPSGEENITVSVTLQNDVITASTFSGEAEHPTSKKLQSLFADGFEESIVGKNLDGLSIGVVNGASLTPVGFNDALDAIRTQAQS